MIALQHWSVLSARAADTLEVLELAEDVLDQMTTYRVRDRVAEARRASMLRDDDLGARSFRSAITVLLSKIGNRLAEGYAVY